MQVETATHMTMRLHHEGLMRNSAPKNHFIGENMDKSKLNLEKQSATETQAS